METSKPDIDVSGLAPVLLDIQVSNGTIKQEPRAAPEAMTSAKEPSRYLSGVRLYLVFSSLLMTVFLTNLDQTIVATALPRIVSAFDALNLATWVAIAYFLTRAGLMLSIGQLLKTVSIKSIFLITVLVFEVGSALCGAAPSIGVLIFGRAVAGCGAAGIVICAIATIAELTPLEIRPALFGCFGSVLAIASIVGPLLGGAFTDKVSWRWCFYINLPFGGLGALAVILFMPHIVPAKSDRTLFEHLKFSFDWLGTVLCLGFSACLLLAMQWGGTTYAWSSPTVIALFCVFGVLLILFVVWQGYWGLRSLVPFTIMKRRTQIGASLEGFWLQMALVVAIYYLPEWYQINGTSAVKAGIDILPFMLSFVVASGVVSAVVSRSGRYWHLLFGAPFISIPGAVLLYLVVPSTERAKLIGYQILLGSGIGGSFQLTSVAVQADWADAPEHTSLASTITIFISFFGGIIGLSIAGTIFDNRLGHEVSKISGLPAGLLAEITQSITVINTLPDDGLRQQVIAAAVRALSPIWLLVLGAICMAILSSL
ncbi:hypothetical protein AcV7_003679 [Taiwanofungus camphoratus]|nr:hypothetical protein AcV7_003679 [Antrodia cinnamomea]